ncbi:type II secretion system F family protein [Ruminiclostridium herbifermentans]|uniref:Type II secretion system F family protein n=1 Tax=Ruminiclostridium herbifermentans TaxID=2488810 RepID=A0A4U7JGE4_9FIRM|nr:type II secretion system F family protein [Ruminiclostridium herbifermentans]QNU65691.1 type II secretion system F family protein [Ruminiclostridium herbifermentans]
MLILNLISALLILLLLIIFCTILYMHGPKYSEHIEALNGRDFKLRIFLPFGLYILDKYCYSYNSDYDRSILNIISEVYGQEYSVFYIRIFHANKVVLVLIGVICELIAGLLSQFQGVFLVYLPLLFSVLIISDDLKLKNKLKKRRLEIQLEFPNFINKLTLLINAGMTMSKAWEKISADCSKVGDFYTEVHKTVIDIKSGKSEAEAFSQFAKRVKTPEISRLMSMIVQSTKRGGNDLVLSLRLLSNECWEMRKNAIKRLGEEAVAKLLIPMMIMFLAIIIIVITPAIISMQGI